MQDERITSRVSRIVIIPVWIYTYKVLKYTNVLLKNFFPIPASAQNGKVGGDVFLLSHIAVEERC